ncbi:MAG: glycosyltransferase family 2 protein [Magnetococcales bacterium]|nr:glycosyltransferase family 2 protein [Magnetococcales bacterium]
MANEMESAELFVRQLLAKCRQWPFRSIRHYVVFDTVCTDGTDEKMAELAKEMDTLEVIMAPENRCVVDAYRRGYDAALKDACHWILEIDAGFSHRLEDMDGFFATLSQGKDCVFGVRFGEPGSGFNGDFKRYLISRGGTWLTNRLLGTKLSDMTSGYALFTHHALSTILAKGIHSRGPFFQTEMRTHAHKMDLAVVPICYHSPSHAVGKSALKDALGTLWRLRQTLKA